MIDLGLIISNHASLNTRANTSRSDLSSVRTLLRASGPLKSVDPLDSVSNYYVPGLFSTTFIVPQYQEYIIEREGEYRTRVYYCGTTLRKVTHPLNDIHACKYKVLNHRQPRGHAGLRASKERRSLGLGI